MFEEATRRKLRYETAQGVLSVEELWDLPLTSHRRVNLNDIAIALHNQLKHDTVSFVDDAEKPDPVLQLRFDVVKYVIDVRKAEMRTAAEASAKAEQKQKILGIIARKEDAALEGMDLDKLREMIGSL
jgi:MoxR-like ATPase